MGLGPNHYPFIDDFVVGRLGLAMLNLSTIFEVFHFSRYECMNGDAKCRK